MYFLVRKLYSYVRRMAFTKRKSAWKFVSKTYKIVHQFFKAHWLPSSMKTVQLARSWWRLKPRTVTMANQGKSSMIYWQVKFENFFHRTLWAPALHWVNFTKRLNFIFWHLDPSDYFLLDAKTGELRTARPLDREALPDATGLIALSVRVNWALFFLFSILFNYFGAFDQFYRLGSSSMASRATTT